MIFSMILKILKKNHKLFFYIYCDNFNKIKIQQNIKMFLANLKNAKNIMQKTFIFIKLLKNNIQKPTLIFKIEAFDIV